MEHQQDFTKGRLAAASHLAAWRETEHSSPEACRRHLRQMIQRELQNAKKNIRSAERGQRLEFWQKHLAYCQGYLAGLGG
jgi:hypothetical protein